MFLKKDQTADPATANAGDQARLQSLEAELNDALQRLDRLNTERDPGSIEGQIAGHPSGTDEQLEALQAVNAAAHKALEEMTADRDNLRKGHVQLRIEMLTAKGKYDAAASALEVRCLEAEAEVVELKEKIATLERRNYHAPPLTASATAETHHPSAFGGRGSGLVAQVSPQSGRARGVPTTRASPSMGRGMSALAVMQLLTPPGTGRGQIGRFAFPPGQRLGAPAANAGQAQEPGGAMDVDQAEHAPETSTVGNGSSNTTTDQGPAQTGPHNSPQ